MPARRASPEGGNRGGVLVDTERDGHHHGAGASKDANATADHPQTPARSRRLEPAQLRSSDGPGDERTRGARCGEQER